jgi:hypothetical protein
MVWRLGGTRRSGERTRKLVLSARAVVRLANLESRLKKQNKNH